MSGLLISFEGGEFAGKSSVCKRIIEEFAKVGIEISLYREPGGTPIGNQIREVLHSKENQEMNPRTELLLYQASRAQLVGVLEPKLKEDEIIILDRFADSTRAYQGEGRGIGKDEVESLIDFATNGLTPHLTILLDIPVSVMNERKRISQGREVNRMDEQKSSFYEAVRESYLQMAEENIDGRWVIIDATRPIDEVIKDVIPIVAEKIRSHFSIEGQTRGKER